MKRPIVDATIAVALAAGAAATIPALARSEAMALETPDRNKQVVRRIYDDCINHNRPELLPELISGNYVDAQGGKGPSGFGRNIDELRTGFPDIHFTLRDLVADGDRVAIRWTWEATHTGTFRSWAPSGRRVTNTGIAIYQLEQGRVVRVWLETDRLGVLQQIGVIPPSLVPGARPVSR